jgi:hypothetical protein
MTGALLRAAAALLLPLSAAAGAGAGAGAGTSVPPAGKLPVPQVIVLAPGASAVEMLAAKELARLLQPLMPDNQSVVPILPGSTAPHFAVGHGAAMAMGAMGWNANGTAPSTTDPFARLSNDSFAILSAHCDLPGEPRCNLPMPATTYVGSVAITGRARGARGTLYGVYEMLRRFLGVKFLASDETAYPESRPTSLPAWNLTFTPSYEYRDVLGWPVMNDPVFAAQLGLNGPSAFGPVGYKGDPSFSLQPVEYASPPGFVHTALRLLDDVNGTHGATANVPPTLRAAHPEWFSLYGKRPFWSRFMPKMIGLPRQARDKHRKS